jgi:hypothetical protein
MLKVLPTLPVPRLREGFKKLVEKALASTRIVELFETTRQKV